MSRRVLYMVQDAEEHSDFVIASISWQGASRRLTAVSIEQLRHGMITLDRFTFSKPFSYSFKHSFTSKVNKVDHSLHKFGVGRR